MRKSRFLALFLTLVMLISLIQLPAFAAAPSLRDSEIGTGSKYWMSSYGDELVHFDYSATGAVSYATTTTVGKNPVDNDFVIIGDDGVISLNSSYAGRYNALPKIQAISAEGDILQIQISSVAGYPMGSKPSGFSAYIGGQYKFDSAYIHDFSDETYTLSDGLIYDRYNPETVDGFVASTVLFENADITSENGNNYMIEAAGKDFIGFRPHYAATGTYGLWHSTVMQFDVYLSSEEDFQVAFVDSDNPILKWNHSTQMLENLSRYTNQGATVSSVIYNSVEPGWHTVKFMFDFRNKKSSNPNPYRATYQRGAVFFDDELIVNDFQLPSLAIYNSKPLEPITTPQNVIRFEGAAGIDNFKYYGSSTPHPYNVKLDSSTLKLGSAVARSADIKSYSFFAAAPGDTAATSYEYTSYYVSDTTDPLGSYTEITTKDPTAPLYLTSDDDDDNDNDKLVINFDESNIGRYIKFGARACYRGGKSPVIYSKPIEIESDYAIEATVEVTGGTETENARFRLSSLYSGDNLDWSLLTNNSGVDVTVTKDGIFTVPHGAEGDALVKVLNTATNEFNIVELQFVPNSEDYENPISSGIEPVIFRADINFANTSAIFAGPEEFIVTSDGIDGVACSDGATFKFVVEDGKYYAFADDKLIRSGDFADSIDSITTDVGAEGVYNYYAGSPLVYEGTFLSSTIGDACESNNIEPPAPDFYNESGVYPKSYTYEWYLNGVRKSTSRQYNIPGGSAGSTLYYTVTGNGVTAKSEIATIVSQYNLDVSSSGECTVSLNTADKDVYVFFVADKKDVYVNDMSYGTPVTEYLDDTDNYHMFFVRKADLSPRGIATRINLRSETYENIPNLTPNLVILMGQDNIYDSGDPALFDEPVSYDELTSLIFDGVILDAYLASTETTSYSDFDKFSEGKYNIISIDEKGNVTQTPHYNELYKFFANTTNYDYPNFESVTKDSLSIDSDGFAELKSILDQVADKENISDLFGTKGTHFASAVILQFISEQSARSDGSLETYGKYLKKAGLSADVVSLMKTSAFYNDAISLVDTIVSSDGVGEVNAMLISTMVLNEVASGTNTANIRYALGFIGSAAFNNATQEVKEYAANAVAKHSYANVSDLKTAVENAIAKYKPENNENNETNEDNKYDKPSSSVSVSGNPYVPVIPTPVPSAPRFSDAPATHWAHAYIEKMAAANVLSGYNGSFRPEDDITRAEYVKVLCAAFGIEAQGEASFNDVSADSWYAPYVNALASAGIAKGDDGNFRPDDKISRQDAAVLLERVLTHVGITLENGELTFSDANDVSDYAKLAVASLVKAGVINGMDDGSYAPANNITRAQVAKLICVAIELGGDK